MSNNLTKPKAHIFFDFDYTLVSEESPIKVLTYTLENHPNRSQILAQLGQIEAKTNINQVELSEIWPLLKAVTHLRRKHIERYIEYTLSHSDPVIPELMKELKARNIQVHMLSAAYVEWIQPITAVWGIDASNVMANQFVWIGDRAITFKVTSLLLTGKAKTLMRWSKKKNISEPIIMVGDSSSDYDVYQKGVAQGFICADYYTPKRLEIPTQTQGNIRRAESLGDLSKQIYELLENC